MFSAGKADFGYYDGYLSNRNINFQTFLYKKQKKHALWCEIGFKQIFTIGGGSESA